MYSFNFEIIYGNLLSFLELVNVHEEDLDEFRDERKGESSETVMEDVHIVHVQEPVKNNEEVESMEPVSEEIKATITAEVSCVLYVHGHSLCLSLSLSLSLSLCVSLSLSLSLSLCLSLSFSLSLRR